MIVRTEIGPMKSRTILAAARIVLGTLFVAGPLSSALHLVSEPALPHSAAAFISALMAAGYMLPLLWTTEIAGGLLVLSGVFAPLGLTVLAPVLVNIAAFHISLAPNGGALAIVACVLEIFLAWQYRDAFASLFAGLGAYREHRTGEASRADA